MTFVISAMAVAAGRSRRMGTQQFPLSFGGQPLVARVVDELSRSPIDQVFTVVGEEGKPIMEAVAGRHVQLVTNTYAEHEMLRSVRYGLTAMPEDIDLPKDYQRAISRRMERKGRSRFPQG